MNEQKIQMIFFDAAGTLFGVRGSVGEIYARFAGQYGKPVEAEAVQREFVRLFPQQPPMAFARELSPTHRLELEIEWWRTLVQEVFAAFAPFPQFHSFFDAVFAYFRSADAWQVFDDIEPTLKILKARGFKLGVISNFDARLYDVLSALQLLEHFDSIHISTEAGAAKPDPEIFRSALQINHLQPGQAVHVGDSLGEDYCGAQAVGIRAVLLDRANKVSQREGILSITTLSSELVISIVEGSIIFT